MPNRLATAISPYLRSHADNPVDWHGWGAEAFAEARARDLPVLVSIGYSTCHWCHVMARESFSDPDLAAYLNEHFVSIKVDREEHPDVDASYLAAAGAFIEGLGWPLNVFVTPDGRAFHAGTYFPPRPMRGQPAFRQVLEAVTEAWTTRRDEVTASAALLSAAITEGTRQHRGGGSLPDAATLGRTVAELAAYEDTTHGGFGGAPKFPAAPALAFLLAQPADGPAAGQALALRALKRMGASPLRDPVEGGFFRYAVNRDWSEPHYERMLYDNAQLLELYTRAWQVTGEQWARSVAEGVADFLITVMQLPGGGFASAQDSESTVDGHRVEGGYYALDAEGRAGETPPALDAKVLTGWNGLAIAALSLAGFAFDNDTFTGAARRAADFLLEHHLPKRGPHDRGTLVRASIDDRVSTAPATLEDYGMFAHGLLHLALLTGESGYATAARGLIDSTLIPATDSPAPADAPADSPAPADVPPLAQPFTAPNGPDPVLAAQGLALDADPSEGAYPSGLSATADAAELLYLLTAERRYRATAEHAMGTLTALAPARPLAFGAALRLIAQLAAPVEQLVVVTPAAAPGREPEDPAGLLAAVRRRGSGLVASVTEAQASAFAASGFELFAERTARAGAPTAYLCRDFVCRLPVTDPANLDPAGGRP
ncbi:thioredoxin domain-containing protein [Cryobacterium sp. TMT1-2-1]|uniref:thioredoxin domain-containing protein n=1 Tax=Cryobacterium sp. TMT1-2-1 TaxID=1259232 RepID=UPI00106C3E0C|nr:DUF255 domain-containing protein [Cryobacterium sp. TMT1-2-1]TFD49050.1 thioredoxin domain-containing protein [Cryobacterium sp. TMT1-2-1]